MKQVPRGKPRLEIKSRTFDPATRASFSVAKHSPHKVIAVIIAFRLQDPFSIETEETTASGSISRDRCHAAVECCVVNGSIHRAYDLCVSNEIDVLTGQVQ